MCFIRVLSRQLSQNMSYIAISYDIDRAYSYPWQMASKTMTVASRIHATNLYHSERELTVSRATYEVRQLDLWGNRQPGWLNIEG